MRAVTAPKMTAFCGPYSRITPVVDAQQWPCGQGAVADADACAWINSIRGAAIASGRRGMTDPR